MKAKHILLIFCALVLASCNKEPEIVFGEDALPAVAMAIIDKPMAEAEDYLVNINYTKRDSTSRRQDYYREYFRPKEILKLIDDGFEKTINNASYEWLQFDTNRDYTLFLIDGVQQFDSPKNALANFRAWVSFVDQLMTDSANWYAAITIFHSMDVKDTATAMVYYGGVRSEEKMQVAEEMGRPYAPRENFYEALNSLKSNQFFQVTMQLTDANHKYIYMDYHTLEQYNKTTSPYGSQQLIVTTERNRRIKFSCMSSSSD